MKGKISSTKSISILKQVWSVDRHIVGFIRFSYKSLQRDQNVINLIKSLHVHQ